MFFFPSRTAEAARLLREHPTYRESQTWSVHDRHLIVELYRYRSKGQVLTAAAAGTRSLKALQLVQKE